MGYATTQCVILVYVFSNGEESIVGVFENENIAETHYYTDRIMTPALMNEVKEFKTLHTNYNKYI
jgi:hypothetical protein